LQLEIAKGEAAGLSREIQGSPKYDLRA
jgi:hypothetical protein